MDARGYVTFAEMRRALRRIYREDREINLHKAVLHALADDLRPVDQKGRWRPNTLLVLLAVLSIALLGIFLYFSIGVRR
jgi:hypothetical protein